MATIKFGYLRKAELEYEITIRGEEPLSTVAEQRKQINKLYKLYPNDSISESTLEEVIDANAARSTLSDLCNLPLSTETDIDRASTIRNHLEYRYCRIHPTSTVLKEKIQQDLLDLEQITIKINSQKTKLRILTPSVEKINPFDSLTLVTEPEPTTSSDTKTQTHTIGDTKLTVNCSENRVTSDLHKHRYDGTTCVRSFILKLEEFRLSRGLSKTKLLNSAYEIFTGNALHWLRHKRQTVDSWDDLVVRLKEDFGSEDYDYRLMSEIRERTQGELESITIYSSIMHGMFSQLSKQPSAEEKLEIILHNIKPCYAEVLAVSNAKTLDELVSICRNYEKYKSRAKLYHEPPRVNTSTLASDYAYTRKSTNSYGNNKQGYNSYYNSKYNYNNSYAQNKSSYYKKQPVLNNNQSAVAAVGTSEPSVSNNQSHAQPVAQISDNRPVSQTNQPRGYTTFCPRCRNTAHSLQQCKEPRFPICFGCGMKDYKKPDCPKCNIKKN